MVNYEPITDPCRVCDRDAPHEMRVTNQGIEVVCIECRALLEFIDNAKALGEALEAASCVG